VWTIISEWASPGTLEAGAMSGSILETWVVTELLKSYWHTGRRPPFYHYRDKDQREIDLLILLDGVLYPLEIKKTDSPGREDVRHFGTLERLQTPVGPGGVICLAEQSLPLTEWAFFNRARVFEYLLTDQCAKFLQDFINR
jgi:hypothetical protein